MELFEKKIRWVVVANFFFFSCILSIDQSDFFMNSVDGVLSQLDSNEMVGESELIEKNNFTGKEAKEKSFEYFYSDPKFKVLSQDLIKDLERYPIREELQTNITMFFKPVELISSWRLDIMAKYIYAQQREMQVKSDWAIKVYAEHLRVWNGFVEKWQPKNSLKDFVEAFHTILDSIKQVGFDAKKSIAYIDKRGILANGAHRLTSCLLYGRDIACQLYPLGPATCASAAFFKRRGLAEKYIDAMVLQYCLLKDLTYIVHIFPAVKGDDVSEEIKKILRFFGHIVYEKQVNLVANGPVNLIKQLYAHEKWLGTYENDFSGAKSATKARFPNGRGAVKVYVLECATLEKVRACKDLLRGLFGIGNPSVHINDTHKETIDLAKIFFNENSIHFLNYGTGKNFEKFEQFFKRYKEWLNSNGVDQQCFCIDSSAVLSAYGIRDCHDLDFLHHGYNEIAHATKNADISSHNSSISHHVVGLDDIIFNPENHFYYKGLKFASLDVVKKMKLKRNEAKDRKDIKLIEDWVNSFVEKK